MNSVWHEWQDEAACHGSPTDLFFDEYENDEGGYPVRHMVDKKCQSCPVMRTCYAYAKYFKLSGVWGGIYLNEGEIDKEMNSHKTDDDWANTYKVFLEQNDLH